MITAKPEDAGLSAERLSRIDGWMDRWVGSGKLPGLSVVVHRRGETVYARTTGMRDVAAGAPMTADTIVRIYSMTKPLTSVAIMMLYEEGRFQLDDPISKVLPSFKNQRVYTGGSRTAPQTVPAVRDITYRDLLTHTSGLTYGFIDSGIVDAMYRAAEVEFNFGNAKLKNPVSSLAEMTDRLATLPLIAQPGTAWNYSNATDVLGRLVEVHAGMPFQDYLVEKVIKPLGMTDTGFSVPEASRPRFAANYVPDGKGGIMLFDDPATSAYLSPPVVPSGGGGLVSTAGDYLRFCRMMLNGGELEGVRLLGVKTVELMTANHLGGDMASLGMPRFSESSYAGIGFGLGFSVMLDPAKAQILGTEGEYAWGGAASTAFWCDPAEEMAVIMLTQLMPSSTYPIRRELRVLTYQAIVD
jgi:CubicO group peptidase (beta-lactamase class C family)